MVQEKQQTKLQKIGSMVYGSIFMAFAVWGFLWNERQRTGAATTLNEILESYVDRTVIGSDTSRVYPYVYVYGQAESEEILVDDLFGLELRALFLERRIEQLVRKVSNTDGNRTVTYDWEMPAGPPFSIYYETPNPLEVSGLRLSEQILDRRLVGEQIRCDDQRIQTVPSLGDRPLFCRSDGMFSNKPEAESLVEGDIRLSLHYLPLEDVSVIGQLSEGVLYPIEDKNRRYLYLLEAGKKMPEELVATARSRVKKSGNIGLGFCVGIFLVGLFFFTAPFWRRQR